MPFIPVENVLQANVRYTLGGQQIENVLNFSFPNLTFEDAADLVNGLLASVFWPILRTQLSNQLVQNGLYCVDLTSESGAVATYPAFANPTGQSSIFAAPGSVAFVITHRTANRGRSYRGRSFVAGIPADKISQSILSTDAADAYASAFATLRSDAEDALVPMVIVSRFTNGAPRSAGVATNVTACVYLNRVVDSQRRRLPGRGT